MQEEEDKVKIFQNILKNGAIKTMFQPLVSMKRRAVFGLEALSRGISSDGFSLIPPNVLFSLPRSAEELLALDRLCREKALESFLPIYRNNSSLLVSLNIDAAIINSSTTASGHLLEVTQKIGINPNNIIIEIIESNAADNDVLMEFVASYKKNGFLIALDDVGTGHSNLDRIPLLKPDLIKIDRSLIEGIDSYFHKKEIVKALQQMASKVGTMVLAEGVERQQEAIICMEMGIEFFQGFFFARPAALDDQDMRAVSTRVDTLATDFKEHIVRGIGEKKRRAEHHRSIVKKLVDEIADLEPAEFTAKMPEFTDHYQPIECVYILNLEGIQITDTIFNNRQTVKRQKRFIYEPARARTDHSLKEYFLPLKAGLRTYTTDPYISMATGNRCITIAAYFRDGTGGQSILCVDLDCDVS